jgi:hypothetical protein
MNADTAIKARLAARRFAERRSQAYPAAVGGGLRDDLDELLIGFRYKSVAERKALTSPEDAPSLNLSSLRTPMEEGPPEPRRVARRLLRGDA